MRALPDIGLLLRCNSAQRPATALNSACKVPPLPVQNGSDPIPWIPKVGFKRSGKRVSINGRGNLILRPSYFELSVMERGTY